MKGYCLQLTLAIILLSSGCMPFQVGVVSDNGRSLPRWPNWDFKETYAEGNAPLPTDVIYIHKSEPRKLLDGEIFIQYWGIRFFENGNVFLTWSESESLLIENLKDIKNGGVGYYSMENDEILIENFTRSMASFWGTIYAATRGTYDEDGTISVTGFGSQINGKLHDVDPPQIYIPIPLPENSNREVDW